MQQTLAKQPVQGAQVPLPVPLKYCLYARKSSEDTSEKQALSIESQVKEMTAIAARDGLEVVEIKRESHSSKEVGQRPIYNEMIEEIRDGKYNAVLAWHPDRLSRNAGDLGAVVDLMDQKKLVEIRTYSQRFTNNPNEKFLLMILGSQAKLENDNKSVNVKRGLRTRCEMGLWPAPAPTGYLNSPKVHEKGVVYVDPKRAPVIRQMFEKAADGWSGRKLYYWLKDTNFKSTGGKHLTLSNIYLILRQHFYTGTFEYPKGGNMWYQGKHQPIIDKELFERVQEKINANRQEMGQRKDFAFTKLMRCGLCGSGVSAQEKWKRQRNGNEHHYIYYGCTKFNDKECPCGYIEEGALIEQLAAMMDKIDLDQIGLKKKLKEEIERVQNFQTHVFGESTGKRKADDAHAREYIKYILRKGQPQEKRDLLSCLRSKLVLDNKVVRLEQ